MTQPRYFLPLIELLSLLLLYSNLYFVWTPGGARTDEVVAAHINKHL
jgi:hypothetical protein